MGATRFEMPRLEADELLVGETVGRLCVIEHGYPLAFPINYRVIRDGEDSRIVFRTSPQTAIARYEGPASIEIDRIDTDGKNAWSVIARGSLRRAIGEHDLPDTQPLVSDGRYQWMVLTVIAISGRRFVSAPASDGFSVEWQSADG